MIDLHSHVLPNIDDGAKSIEMSLEMLSMSKKQGVEIVAATPHCIPESEDKVDEFLCKRLASYQSIKDKITDNALYPKLLLGAEVYLGTDISEYRNLNSLCFENTEYIMLEMSEDVPLNKITEWVYNIKIKGLKPVIAHVDRYSKCFDFIEELSPLGIKFQINASRFFTMKDRRKLKNIFNMYDRYYISSDMHNLTTRASQMDRARIICDKKYPTISKRLFEGIASEIINNR